jgi:hypothetical protein
VIEQVGKRDERLAMAVIDEESATRRQRRGSQVRCQIKRPGIDQITFAPEDSHRFPVLGKQLQATLSSFHI